MRTHSIILLESNTAILAQMKEVLKDCEDFTLLHSGEDGDEGIKYILENKPDVVVVSMFLKGADGYAVMQSIRKISPNTKIIATGISNDAYNEVYCDMMECGIVDPTKVTRSALQNAASVASTVLTTEAIVADKKEENPAPAVPPQMGGMY